MGSTKSGWTCEDCGTSYRLKIFTCPRCKGTRFAEVNGMAKISTFGGVTDVRASGLLPGTAGELPEEVVHRADGTTTLVNGEVEDVDSTPDADPDDTDSDTSDPASGEPAASITSADEDDTDPPAGQSGREDDVDRADDPPFDPGDFTVAEVKDKLDGLDDDDREKVIAAERAGKNRTGITG